MAQLQDKVAIVTGAASGIGREIAHRFGREGAKVVIADLKLDVAQATVDAFAADGITAMAVAMDVSDEAAVNNGVAAVITAWGRVDVLVSNAGIQIVHPIEDYPFADWKKMMAIHLDGAFLTTKACIKSMYATGGGSIIYIGSVHSKEASVLKSAYVTAKHGLVGLSKTVALEVATAKITVNCISPGYVWTPLVENQIPDTMKARNLTRDQVINDVLLDSQPTKEFVTPEQVAAIAVFLCSDAAQQITGANISVDGGWTAE
jgi:3-hydroxybutyrate dehydrogenase